VGRRLIKEDTYEASLHRTTRHGRHGGAPTAIDTGGAMVVESPGNAQVTTQPGAAALQASELQYPVFGYGGLLFANGYPGDRGVE
jgi:hypothetical protein